MADLGSFNANDVEPNTGFEVIPEGKYNAIIMGSENKPTKKGNGSYLELTFQILDGKYANRNLWERLNLQNPNDQAVKIAQGWLSAICRAVNVMTPKDSNELHDLPLVIDVKCEKRDDNGEMTNVIKGYEPRGSAAATAPVQNVGDQAAPWS